MERSRRPPLMMYDVRDDACHPAMDESAASTFGASASVPRWSAASTASLSLPLDARHRTPGVAMLYDDGTDARARGSCGARGRASSSACPTPRVAGGARTSASATNEMRPPGPRPSSEASLSTPYVLGDDDLWLPVDDCWPRARQGLESDEVSLLHRTRGRH